MRGAVRARRRRRGYRGGASRGGVGFDEAAAAGMMEKLKAAQKAAPGGWCGARG